MDENPYESPQEPGISRPHHINPRFVGALCLLGLALALVGGGLAIVDHLSRLLSLSPGMRPLRFFAGAAGTASALAFAIALFAFLAFGTTNGE
jgi:hypothetical protein